MYNIALTSRLRQRLAISTGRASRRPCFCTRRHQHTLPQWSPQPRPGEKVFLAMSGGVDSSVCALLLTHLSPTLAHPLDLQPIYMRNWSTLEESTSFEPGSGGAAGCEWQREWESVQDVCRVLQLPEPRLVDLSREYWASVFEPSLDVWQRGETPNPDVLCNREIKFGALYQRLMVGGGDERTWLATGHYARVVHSRNGEAQLHRAAHRGKDQSYFLSSVPSTALQRALFPLARLTKPEVRDLARHYGLPTAAKKESMGLCFVGKREQRSLDRQKSAPSFGGWLSGYLPPATPYTTPGPILALTPDVQHTRIGTHEGLHTLTIGQRAKMPNLKERWFVAAKRVRDDDGVGEAIVVPGQDHPMLQCVYVEVPMERFEWVSKRGAPEELGVVEEGGVPLLAQLRHRSPEVPCRVSLRRTPSSSLLLRVTFDVDEHGQRPTAVCPGQTLALYDGQRCLGSVVVPGEQELGGVRTVGQLQQELVEPERAIGGVDEAGSNMILRRYRAGSDPSFSPTHGITTR